MNERALSAIIYFFSIWPFWALYLLSDMLYFFFYHIWGYRKKIVLENLRNSFPEKSDEDIKKIAKEFYRHLPDVIVESVKMRSISATEATKRMELLNPEEIYRHFDNGRGVIGVTAHYGNWEYGVHCVSLMTEHPRLVIYKPLTNKTFDTVYNKIRMRFGATMVPMKQILRHIVALRHKPHISIFAADQTPPYQESDFYIPFLNQETLVYTGVGRIAKMTDLPVVFCEIRRKAKRGYYTCKITTLAEHPKQMSEHDITRLHNAFLEEIIQSEPAYWLWSHRRWKRKRRS